MPSIEAELVNKENCKAGRHDWEMEVFVEADYGAFGSPCRHCPAILRPDGAVKYPQEESGCLFLLTALGLLFAYGLMILGFFVLMNLLIG